MKIVLVVLVACFAYVQCQNTQCIIDEVTGNTNLQTCAQMLAQQSGGNFDVNAFCGLSCLGDLRALYDRCGFSPNPVSASKCTHAKVTRIASYSYRI